MFGFFKKNKGPFSATIQPSGQVITVKSGSSENLLKAALEAGIKWPYSCRVGSCGTCKCRLASGQIKPLADFSYVLSGEDLDAGYILACQTMLKSDIEVELETLDGADGVDLAKSRKLNGKIARLSPLTHDILEVQIELDGEFKDYLAGQYADVLLPGVVERARSYSFSKAPNNESPNQVSFFVRRVKNGALTEWLHAADRVGEKVVLDGPHGAFYLRQSSGPILLIAGGSGLAPIRALLQQIENEGRSIDITLIFGARTQKDLYCLDDIEKFASKAKGKFQFVPVLSVETNESGWNGAVGNCPDAIKLDMLEPQSSQAYLCGPPVMIDAAVDRLKAMGLKESQIFFDKFLDSSSMPAGRA
ncbi:Oxidoreductase FAD/NAD(P)-binding domain protein [Hyphomicrobium sp. GJ21]|jgi:CDP-4-dehydro-6-deoxyglucose reductase|uniref:2Fe-2S iron-sulfur cluster-binding protein n=1 Tax=Hyphomicrobium sp. GJ21 TaxID=113574 RepID=UPI000622C018|nr:2Fe-2S iron-sulfur cluster binding domain-containing protein [Hyphomicrobium sp. GJ21]CEJ86304.1 Oxidoreductase FAD/NAD(P)-binding domain protein [Hyphomicrobium sp. GJ21]